MTSRLNPSAGTSCPVADGSTGGPGIVARLILAAPSWLVFELYSGMLRRKPVFCPLAFRLIIDTHGHALRGKNNAAVVAAIPARMSTVNATPVQPAPSK